jgi:hypothetical protein
MYSHLRRRRPGRLRSNNLWMLAITLIVLVSVTLASDPPQQHTADDAPLAERLPRWGEIEFGRREPPSGQLFERRQNNNSPTPSSESLPSSTRRNLASNSSSTMVAIPTTTASDSASAKASPTSPSDAGSVGNVNDGDSGTLETASAEPGSASVLPTPFDTSMGSNFTSPGCPAFFNDLLQNGTLKDCHPASLLLENSNSFFRASRSSKLLSRALDASCGASLAECSPLMAFFASSLLEDSNCGQDFRNENPLVTRAYSGLVAYEPIYRATCLQNSETRSYCFVDAITNSTSPTDSYPYYAALGSPLPAASRPTCSKCLQDTMGIFAGYATMQSQPLSRTYTGVAEQIDRGCGPDFVNATVPVGTTSNATVVSVSWAMISAFAAALFALSTTLL